MTPADLAPVDDLAHVSGRQLQIARILWARLNNYYLDFMLAIAPFRVDVLTRFVFTFLRLSGVKIMNSPFRWGTGEHIEILIDRRLTREELTHVSRIEELSEAQLEIVRRLAPAHQQLCLYYLRIVAGSNDEERQRLIERMRG